MTDYPTISSPTDSRTNFELIRDTLAQFDPETRSLIIDAMIEVQKMSRPVFIRFMLDLHMRSYTRYRPISIITDFN